MPRWSLIDDRSHPWDASSNLVSTQSDGVTTIYAYDAGGQRVAQATVASGATTGTATPYVAGGEVTDPNTDAASLSDVTATRFYTFGGATVAVRTGAGGFWLLFGDEQGSAQIMMPATIGAGGALAAATLADAANVQRTAYEPYGARRGAEDLDINRGWLGQTEDAGTGLTYLNARYYDPMIGRFLSPDPLMDPGDPRTLDPYRYADNNPNVYLDTSGLAPSCSGLTGTAYTNCNNYAKNTYNYATGVTVAQVRAQRYSDARTGYTPRSTGSPLTAAIAMLYSETARAVASPEAQDLRKANAAYGSNVVGSVLSNASMCYAGNARAASCSRAGLVAGIEPVSGVVIGVVGLGQMRFWASEGPNDMKVSLSSKVPYVVGGDRNRWIVDADGSRIRQDVFGNLQFGAVYAVAGSSLEDTLTVSHATKVAGIDDPIDDVPIQLGFALVAMYPNGASESDFQDYMRSPQVRRILREAGLYQPPGAT